MKIGIIVYLQKSHTYLAVLKLYEKLKKKVMMLKDNQNPVF
ncbi:MAG: hypothetical protein PHP12_01325 [Bacilli bacterium]|nr:hypothetical protein [Bacilli bacterium]